MAGWPTPPNPETLFTKALLVHGPIPDKGWYVQRFHKSKKAAYVFPRSLQTRKVTLNLIVFFIEEAKKTEPTHKWKANFLENVGRHWKNHFMRWLWEQKEND